MSVTKGKVTVNHVLLFSIGFVYYFALPILIGLNNLFIEEKTMQTWYIIFNNIDLESLAYYLIIILAFYCSYILGAKSARNKVIKKKKLNLDFYKVVLNLFLFAIIISSFFFIYQFRGEFFTGYSGEIDSVEKGPFVALSLVAIVLAIIYSSKVYETNNLENKIFHKIFINRYFIVYFILSFLILSLGGRLYFISSLLMMLTYYNNYYKKIKLNHFIYLIVIIVFLMGLIGVVRTSTTDVSMFNILLNVFQETIFTSFSLIAFIDKANFVPFKFPIYLLSSFVNLIPSIIFPDKLSYRISIIESGYPIYNPIGALNSFTSFMINFGYVGTILFLFGLGFFLERQKNNRNSILSKTIYVCVSGFLTFTFFRDGFETSLVKNIFQFSILTPIVIIFLAQVLSRVIKNNK